MVTPPAGSDTPAIHTQDLAKKYGHVTALAGLTMTVPKGEVFGFLGPNGAGKTTSVKLLLGLTEPTSAQAWLLGAPLGNLARRPRGGDRPAPARTPGPRGPLGRAGLPVGARVGRVPEPDQRPAVVAPRQQGLRVCVEQPGGPRLARTYFELRHLEPYHRGLILTEVTPDAGYDDRELDALVRRKGCRLG